MKNTHRCPVMFVIALCSAWALLVINQSKLRAQDSSPSPVAAAPSTAAAPKADTEWDGVTVELTGVTRGDGDTVTIKFKYSNTGSKEMNISALGQFGGENVAEHVYYVDAKNKKKYLVVKDAEGNEVASKMRYLKLGAGESRAGWGKFPAPPAGVDKITVYIPGAPPFESVAIAAP